MDRIRLHNERRKQDQELQVEMTRSFMALMANINRGKSQPPISPQDFFRLSYDGEQVEEKKLTAEEQREHLKKLEARFNR